jgi:hypothetical protein
VPSKNVGPRNVQGIEQLREGVGEIRYRKRSGTRVGETETKVIEGDRPIPKLGKPGNDARILAAAARRPVHKDDCVSRTGRADVDLPVGRIDERAMGARMTHNRLAGRWRMPDYALSSEFRFRPSGTGIMPFAHDDGS